MLWITDENELDLKSGLSAIYFYSHQDPHHFAVFNHLEDIEAQYTTIRFYTAEAVSFPKLVKRHSISSLPFIKVFKDEGQTMKSLSKVANIFDKAIWADIEDRYQQGEQRARERRSISDQPKTNSGIPTATGSVGVAQDLGADQGLRSPAILPPQPAGE